MHDARTPRVNEDSPDDNQETLQTLRPDGTLGESERTWRRALPWKASCAIAARAGARS